jgi:Na+-transporting NADH:ubiquinone oxidoreductase subunit NqrB
MYGLIGLGFHWVVNGIQKLADSVNESQARWLDAHIPKIIQYLYDVVTWPITLGVALLVGMAVDWQWVQAWIRGEEKHG